MTDSIGQETATGGAGSFRAELFGLLRAGAEEAEALQLLRREVDGLTAGLRAARREIEDLRLVVLGFEGRQGLIWNVLDRRGVMRAGRRVRSARSANTGGDGAGRRERS
jgi:hypothetical protein